MYTYGPKRAPFCVRCAIAAAGVRSNAGVVPKASPKQIKKEFRARKGWRELRALRRSFRPIRAPPGC